MSSQYQKDMADSMKQMAESFNRLSNKDKSQKVAETENLMGSALDSNDAIKGSAEEEESDNIVERDEARRSGKDAAGDALSASKYNSEHNIQMTDRLLTRRQELSGEARRESSSDAMDNVLDSVDDADQLSDLGPETLDDFRGEGEDPNLKKEIGGVLSDATQSVSKTDSALKKANAKDRLQLREANAKHLMDLEDCPPGYTPRSKATPQQLAAAASPGEPCPVALADAPCPCIMEAFEPLTAEPDEPAQAKEAELADPEGTDDCDDFLRNVENEFGENMSSISHEAIEPFKKRLKPGAQAGIRKVLQA
ncbi:hypothetical protein GNI_001260 [Gregarina niphandrodes]|uniref:Uncharacterized protein n=1 Tax=Gregarina niphandrodes TaxID=110365 RepID=A0A023BE45_GRENI|nr:hypothetical protein GNI_001260 [Gregarina niphandrodes]EZG89690.1 hypothetical protein GNI_001260 [Gregarina niphandrodes]|eukprot:XP_011128464.1 hypothetical protein GNI_001260 [Gregarina niphandrodes]